MHVELTLPEVQKKWHGSLKAYLIGFFLCLITTSLSFVLTVFYKGPLLLIALLAPIQALIQLFFFLHIAQEAKPRWGLLIFVSMVLVLMIIVLGSLWIMYDLNERTMSGMMP